MPQLDGFWSPIVEDVVRSLGGWLPRLAGALVVLVVGWVVAVLARALVGGVMRRLGVDRAAERAGFSSSLAAVGMERSASALLGRLAYWLVLLFFALIALEGMGLAGVSDTLGELLGYLPRVFLAAFVLLIGGFLARVLGDGAGAMAVQYGVSGGVWVGQITRYLILVVTGIVALQQLLIDTTLLTAILVILLGALAVTLTLALGLGTRDLAARVVAGLYARDTFQAGQRLRLGEHEGKLLSIGRTTSLLETESGRLAVPNEALLEREILILADEEDGEPAS